MSAVIANPGSAAALNPPTDPPCPACSSSESAAMGVVNAQRQHLAYAHGDRPAARRLDKALGDRRLRYEMQRCKVCRLEFARPAQAPSEFWYAELYRQLQLYPQQRWEFDVVRQALSREQAVVDYGCGTGEFLLGARKQVRHAYGFDFSRGAIEAAKQRGVDARLLHLAPTDGTQLLPVGADHITAFHVLEHLEQPAALFRFATTVAAPTARLWVAVPSDQRASRVYGEPDALDSPPHHLTRWTEKALVAVGEPNGWTLEAFLYEPLSERLAVWETTRRLALYQQLQTPWRPLQWLVRRGLAAAVWAGRRHHAASLSGFSMLARYRLSEAK